MKVIERMDVLLSYLADLKRNGERLAFVPTMGNLHDGHLKLVKQGKLLAERVIVSIFVNRRQFGVNEDFESYPRSLKEDIAGLEKIGADVLYVPQVETEVFGDNYSLKLDIPSLTHVLCGASRPDFFGGVLAVVSQFFLQIRPDFAIFGKKDYQQFLVVSALAKSLNIGIEVVGVETVREESGLAMSSRNNYLNQDDRKNASFIYKTLLYGKEKALNGLDIQDIIKEMEAKLLHNGISKIDYLEIRDKENLSLISNLKPGRGVIFFAGFFKDVRLIDNIEI